MFAAGTFLLSALRYNYNLFERRILAYKRFYEPRITPLTLEPVPVDSLTVPAESIPS